MRKDGIAGVNLSSTILVYRRAGVTAERQGYFYAHGVKQKRRWRASIRTDRALPSDEIDATEAQDQRS